MPSQPPAPPTAAPENTPDADWAEFEEALTAWDELGIPVPASEVRAALAADVTVLNQQPKPPAPPEPEPVPGAPGALVPTPRPASEPAPVAAPPTASAAASAVHTATAEADAHADRLKDHPEWQRIQTLRGALGNVWNVLKEKAGPHWDALRADVRFQGFWKTASIRACQAISNSAASLANRLSRGGDLPAADALLKLSDSTITYSTAAADPTSAPVPPSAQKAPADKTPAVEEPAMQRLVERSTPPPYATREDALRAGQEVTARFHAWIGSPMGQELAESSHRRVADFREAWQKLPAHAAGPALAVGPYTDVAERAKALVTAAVGAARFEPGDLQTLQALAQAADNHAARLSVTLPPGVAAKAPTAAAPPPRAATPTLPAAPAPRASA
ncbi:hypothetical protein ABZW02_29565 [Streptomyces sp. NPDC005180]|uniref:hypothetical protein n=1 Tax=Streptomyces sp. NPDC005180 TaxID=3156868 RepID=UPI0033B1E207